MTLCDMVGLGRATFETLDSPGIYMDVSRETCQNIELRGDTSSVRAVLSHCRVSILAAVCFV
jgi:hypothetical protein